MCDTVRSKDITWTTTWEFTELLMVDDQMSDLKVVVKAKSLFFILVLILYTVSHIKKVMRLFDCDIKK